MNPDNPNFRTQEEAKRAEEFISMKKQIAIYEAALKEIAKYKEFRPEMMQFRLSNGEFENFGRFARNVLAEAAKLKEGK